MHINRLISKAIFGVHSIWLCIMAVKCDWYENVQICVIWTSPAVNTVNLSAVQFYCTVEIKRLNFFKVWTAKWQCHLGRWQAQTHVSSTRYSCLILISWMQSLGNNCSTFYLFWKWKNINIYNKIYLMYWLLNVVKL